ncbi:MAG: hypothetical protein WCW52_05990 [Elusimicrobiales bacterium]|jgi:hypothetical protein
MTDFAVEKYTLRGLLKQMLSMRALKRTLPSLMFKRGEPLYLSVAVHTEHVHDAAIFRDMADFGKQLPFRAAAFVMTPRSAIIAKEMSENGVSEEDFSGRLKALGEIYDIGLHGHYCRPRPAGAAKYEPADWLVKAGFEQTSDLPLEIREQFAAEYDYLCGTTGRPRIYSGGWWFMNETVVSLLEEFGLRADCSLRRGYADSFGNRYLPVRAMPGRGRPFILPPSKEVVEFPSTAYLYEDWWRLVRELAPLLAGSGGPRFAVLPAHDHNITEYGGKMLENIRLLSNIRNVRFVPFPRMRELALEAGAVDKVSPFQERP